ncbi:DEAD/DEAH box helicase [Actinomyces sp. B33]|uniref:DEAD/DEAH box helicase n=1 Tax=Actinomyces sp. B33 TaxID=2942131 RepID=UPI0023406AC8|nr:DEAD/DEAH box helicase [Actinomyces sp. B33]MDC4233311.1 DEAD/DEAH box helicase [Actinomyces sp. B33]
MTPSRRRRRASMPAGEPERTAPSPSERFAAFRAEQAEEASERRSWSESLGFSPDPFQVDAMRAVEEGDCVLVAAPTGAGKTVVGEFATHLALVRGRRSFYTTPIKALSNQKFLDLRARFGEDRVGLLTGDTSINPQAPVVVMTTEVLRNMIYAGADLADLDSVVLDEVHYLADRFRGPVWEEVIIHLPQRIQIVALSATVSNAEEFGAWIHEVRGSCRIVVSETRPVPLYQHMIVGDELFDLYAPTRRGAAPADRLNPELLAAVSPGALGGRGGGGRGRQDGGRRRPARRESRPSTLIALDRAGLLPAITFIFSRAGCEDAVAQVLASGIVLTSRQEAARIREYVDAAMAVVDPADVAVLGLDRWARGLERGVAAHHAGMLPMMKEVVEHLFAEGLVKQVFATETLALGINMPARTVVIEALRKWNGAEHVQVTPGEYTQLSGRAGRRGIDVEGHAVVLHRGSVAPEEVAALASKRTYPLISAFHPTYNMVVNLLEHSSRAATRDVLETSFAQFQADGAVVQLATRARRLDERMARLAEEMSCDAGDAREYFDLRDRISRAQKEGARERARRTREEALDRLSRVRPGDVVAYRSGRRQLHGVVAVVARTASGTRVPQVVGTDGKLHPLLAEDVSGGMGVVGSMRIPGGSALNRNKARTRIGDDLRRLVRSGSLAPMPRTGSGAGEGTADAERRLRAHPVHRCPHREEHARAGSQWARARREADQVAASIDARTNSVAKEFDRVCAVLDELGFLDGEAVTASGRALRRVFGERSLVTMEAVSSGAWDRLGPAELAAIVSACVFESRSDEPGPAAPPAGLGAALDEAWEATAAAMGRVHRAERRAGAALTPQIDAGMMLACLAWARGEPLTRALAACDLQGGDFVRWVRQVMDALDQLRRIDREPLATVAQSARRSLVRGVVSWSNL